MSNFPTHKVASIGDLVPCTLDRRTDSDSQFAAVLAGKPVFTAEQARRLTCPVIYGLCNDKRGVFYIGKTVRPNRRIYDYQNPKQCHNNSLAEYLTDNPDFSVAIFEESPQDIDESELLYIQKYKGHTFNIDLVDYKIWREHKTQPWMAGAGVRCPSDYMMWQAAKAGGVAIKKAFSEHIEMRNKMSKKQRICFEVGLYKDSNPQLQKVMQKWFDRCKHDLLEGLL